MNLKLVAGVETSTRKRHSARLRAFTIAISLAAAATFAAVIVAGGHAIHVDRWGVIALILLTVIGTHGEEVFGDETAINGSILVIMAGAGIAYAGGPLWVAGACGLVAGLHWHHLRDCAARKILVNTCFTTLSALAAAEVARAIRSDNPAFIALAGSALAVAAAYWLTDNVLVAVVLAVVHERPLRAHVRELIRSETEVIPFAVLGFMNGYAFVRSGAWAGVLGTLALLVVTELLVFRHGRRGSIRRCAQWVPRIVPVVAAGVVLAAGGIGTVRHGDVLLLIATIALVGAAVLDRARARFGLCSLVACVAAAVIAIQGDRPIVVAVVVGSGICLGLAIRRRRARNRLTILSAAALAALSVGGTASVLQAGLVASPEGCLLFGVTAGLAALVAWHIVVGSMLTLDLGLGALPAAVSVMRGDVLFVLVAGVCGAGSGWIGTQWGVAGLATSLVVLLLVAWALIGRSGRRESAPYEPAFADDELLDVVRSALLDLPASRLPD